MAQTHLIPPHLQAVHDVHRETFAALMDLYEQNFMRLRKLMPADVRAGQCFVSSVVGCLDLHLEVLETSRFTSLVRLTYLYLKNDSQAKDGLQPEPDLHIRIYHDVEMAEVISGQLHHGRLLLNNLPETAIDERWQLNRFLYKWLGFCLHIGHHFSRSESSNLLNQQLNRIIKQKKQAF